MSNYYRYPPTAGNYFNPRAAYAANTRQIRREEDMARMEHAAARAAARGGMPMGGGAVAMPSIPGVTPFQMGQEAANNAWAEQQATYSLLDQLRGNDAPAPQILRNRGLAQMLTGGNLFEDDPGMNAVDPMQYHQWNLEAAGALAPRMDISVGQGKTIEQKAQDAAAIAANVPTALERSNPMFDVLGVRENVDAKALGRAIDAAAENRPTSVTPELLSSIRQFLMQRLAETADKSDAAGKPVPPYYVPGTRGGMLTLPSTTRGYNMLDELIGNENLPPSVILDINKSRRHSPLGDRKYWEQQVPEGTWFPVGGGF